MEARLIPWKKLRPPPEPLRASMGDDPMQELIESIRTIGVLFPLLVKPYGDGPVPKAAGEDTAALDDYIAAGLDFQIIDGHRRWLACEKAGVELVPCTITSADYDTAHAMMLHANIMREDVSPAEEGWQFLELATKHQWSLDRLMKVFKVSEGYINDRVELVQKDDAVAQAVHTRLINLSQAKQIIREKDPGYRLYLMDQATTHGANAKTLEVMRASHRQQEAAAQGQLLAHTPANATPPPADAPRVCIWCGQGHDPENLRQVDVHWYHQAELDAICNQVGAKNLLGSSPAPAKEG